MATDSQSRTRRTLGAVVLVVVAFAIAMRLRARHSPAEEQDSSFDTSPADSASAPPPAPSSSNAPSRAIGGRASSTPALSPYKSIAHYVSALLPKDAHILALSSGAGTALAVGEHGAVFVYSLDRSAWTAEPPVTDRTLRAVAQQLDRAVAVGDDGTILERDGRGWSLVASPTRRTLRAVAYSTYGVVAAGDAGTLVTKLGEGQPWRVEPTLTRNDLFGACSGLHDLWVVGAAGAMLLRDPEGFKSAAPITSNALYAVACDDHAAAAVGAHGTLLERRGEAGWYEVTSGTTADLYAIAAPMGAQSFLVVGDHGTILHVTNDAAAEPQSVGWTLRAATEGPLGTWIGGDEGLLRRATD